MEGPDPIQSSHHFTILYYTILYYTILSHTTLFTLFTERSIPDVLSYTILYYTILCCNIIYYTILYFTILYYTILYYTILYYTLLTLEWDSHVDVDFEGSRHQFRLGPKLDSLVVKALAPCHRGCKFESPPNHCIVRIYCISLQQFFTFQLKCVYNT